MSLLLEVCSVASMALRARRIVVVASGSEAKVATK